METKSAYKIERLRGMMPEEGVIITKLNNIPGTEYLSPKSNGPITKYYGEININPDGRPTKKLIIEQEGNKVFLARAQIEKLLGYCDRFKVK